MLKSQLISTMIQVSFEQQTRTEANEVPIIVSAFSPMGHPNVKCGRANSKLEDNLSDSELYKSESSDEDMPSCLMHPNVNIARDVKFMESMHPKCNFIDHPNVIVSRSHKFRHCQKMKELPNKSCCHWQRAPGSKWLMKKNVKLEQSSKLCCQSIEVQVSSCGEKKNEVYD
jgi:hypothetical protein